MSAETLRRAAALMRENAEAADDGHVWVAEGSYVDTDPECGFNAGTSLLADHIASWHPAVALAVADCIDAALCYFDPDEFSEAEREMHDSLLTLARAYLNESA